MSEKNLQHKNFEKMPQNTNKNSHFQWFCRLASLFKYIWGILKRMFCRIKNSFQSVFQTHSSIPIIKPYISKEVCFLQYLFFNILFIIMIGSWETAFMLSRMTFVSCLELNQSQNKKINFQGRSVFVK